MKSARSFALACLLLAGVPLAAGPFTSAHAQAKPESQAKPEGEMRWALYVTIAPLWFDPGESVIGVLTPFWVVYALHDALVKPTPAGMLTPSLAESWTVSADQKVYEFKLREGLKFHNGDPFTAEDVKWSFHRTKGAKLLQDKVREVTIVDPYRVRFVLHEPFPDFMTSTERSRPGRAGSCPRSTSSRSAPMASRSTRSASAPTSSSVARRASISSWKPTRATGERSRR